MLESNISFLCHKVIVGPGWLANSTADDRFVEMEEEKKYFPEEADLKEKYAIYLTYLCDCF